MHHHCGDPDVHRSWGNCIHRGLLDDEHDRKEDRTQNRKATPAQRQEVLLNVGPQPFIFSGGPCMNWIKKIFGIHSPSKEWIAAIMQNRKIIAVDFDGTLCEGDHYPNIGPPRMKVIRYILGQQRLGASIILWTCRTGEALQQAVDWCAQYGLYFDAVNENECQTFDWMKGEESRKIFAHEYIDDRAIRV